MPVVVLAVTVSESVGVIVAMVVLVLAVIVKECLDRSSAYDLILATVFLSTFVNIYDKDFETKHTWCGLWMGSRVHRRFSSARSSIFPSTYEIVPIKINLTHDSQYQQSN